MIHYSTIDKQLTVFLHGRIEASNVSVLEDEVQALLAKQEYQEMILDASGLIYCSSAGLRMILRLKKAIPATSIINVHPEVYNILEMTGFTDMMTVQRAYRVLSVEGCRFIGSGANGQVYRISNDTVVKVYLHGDALPEIERERELARKAFVSGIPTAIPYDVVRIKGGGYGSVYELLNATTLAELLVQKKMTPDEAALHSCELLKLIHSKTDDKKELPDMKRIATGWVAFLKPYLPAETLTRLGTLICELPEEDHILHGDFNLRNIVMQDGECLLIDMDTLCRGNPILELAGMYNAYVGYGIPDKEYQESFMGIPHELSKTVWRRTLELYLNTKDSALLNHVETQAQLIGSMRIMRREIRRDGFKRSGAKKRIQYCEQTLIRLVPQVQSLAL